MNEAIASLLALPDFFFCFQPQRSRGSHGFVAAVTGAGCIADGFNYLLKLANFRRDSYSDNFAFIKNLHKFILKITTFFMRFARERRKLSRFFFACLSARFSRCRGCCDKTIFIFLLLPLCRFKKLLTILHMRTAPSCAATPWTCDKRNDVNKNWFHDDDDERRRKKLLARRKVLCIN